MSSRPCQSELSKLKEEEKPRESRDQGEGGQGQLQCAPSTSSLPVSVLMPQGSQQEAESKPQSSSITMGDTGSGQGTEASPGGPGSSNEGAAGGGQEEATSKKSTVVVNPRVVPMEGALSSPEVRLSRVTVPGRASMPASQDSASQRSRQVYQRLRFPRIYFKHQRGRSRRPGPDL